MSSLVLNEEGIAYYIFAFQPEENVPPSKTLHEMLKKRGRDIAPSSIIEPKDKPGLYDLAYQMLEKFLRSEGARILKIDREFGVVYCQSVVTSEEQDRVVRLVK